MSDVLAGQIDACVVRYRELIQPVSFDIDSVDRYRSVCENILAGQYRLETVATGQRIYENQILQNTVIMWMVVTITISGVVLAGIQLWATYRLTMAGKGMLAEGGEVSIEHKRMVVRSSVVGVLILALALVFFAVYVLYVYRIEDIPGQEVVMPPPRSTEDAQVVPR